ncbi:MAG: RNase adapter RapZ [Oscillospiraceae bacterium]|nr:RNase adapter RapZ [Oscillospiraceae bacterium]
MEIIIITGLSGSGKSCVADILEDTGYFCADNLPPQLITKFAEICRESPAIEKVALVTDIRGGSMFLSLPERLDDLREKGFNVKLLYADADPEAIKKRFSETRRRHPLIDMAGGDLDKAIAAERDILAPMKQVADFYIDTSVIAVSRLKEHISELLSQDFSGTMAITCMSFGFKHGIPGQTDLMFDVRFLPNPFYEENLKQKTGLEKEVRDFVMDSDVTKTALEKIGDLLDFLIPEYVKEGKSRLTIAFGCTGGRHRSVALAEYFRDELKSKGYNAGVLHRNIGEQGGR